MMKVLVRCGLLVHISLQILAGRLKIPQFCYMSTPEPGSSDGRVFRVCIHDDKFDNGELG
jgi:hypothetical protein